MKSQYILGAAFSCLLAGTACEKVLDKTDLTAIGGELIFNDSTLARMNLDYIYDRNLPEEWGGTWGTVPELSEESYGESDFFEGTLQIDDVSDFGTRLDANNSYGNIRTINQFLADMEMATFSEEAKTRLKAQALFFRAWRYFELVKLYGGVPLVLEPLEAVGDAAKEAAFLPRNPTSECVAQIVADLDAAIEGLPGRWYDEDINWGRITSGAAAALKGRVLLYWASPQFNPNDLAERWQMAYDANKQAYDLLTANGFGLHPSYENMWFEEVGNPEAVFITGFNTSSSDQQMKNNGYDDGTRPAYLGTGGGANQPSWEMAKAYPMLDGKRPGESATYTYSDQLFYKNRDPRFNKTIAYNGAAWHILGDENYRLWTYFAEGESVESDATSTGFYCRKAIDPELPVSEVQYSGTDWMEIRFAEVLLNLAESACGIDNMDVAYTQLKAIRERAGIEAGADGMYGLEVGMSREKMFEAVLYERQIELAFEGKRFWDLRRWKLFESTLNGKHRTGVVISLKEGPGIPTAEEFESSRNEEDLDNAYANYFSVEFKNLDPEYPISWKPEYYFFPIPQRAIDNNPELLQNKGWGGAFDPLQ